MKAPRIKFIKFLFVFLFTCKISYAQHSLPLEIIANPDSSDVIVFGNFSFDGSPVSSKTLVFSTLSGIVVNSKMKRSGATRKNINWLLNINPLIIGMNPFNWNNIVKQPVDSFYADRLPYSEDALLHLGFKSNAWKKIARSGGNENIYQSFFADLYWRPYIIDFENNDFRFQVVNFNTGYQIGNLQRNLPTVGNFMMSFSPQFNFMFINESDNNLENYRAIAGEKFRGNNYLGTGVKLSAQTNFLNVSVEMRQYWALDNGFKGQTFTRNPTLLVSAFYTPRFYKRKRVQTEDAGDDWPGIK